MHIKIALILSLSLFVSCNGSNKDDFSDIENIPVNINNTISDISTFLDKIEIVPLETMDKSLFHQEKKVLYNQDMDLFAIYTNRQNVVTFSGDGKFVGNSEPKRGSGPKEYQMVTNFYLTPWNNSIVLLNPYGKIYTYSPDFVFKNVKEINSEFPINSLTPLDTINYLMTYPSYWCGEEVAILNMNNGEIMNIPYSKTISAGNGNDDSEVFKIEDKYYFRPKGLNYYIFELNLTDKILTPMIFFDYGEDEIKEDGLPGIAIEKRTRNANKRIQIHEEYSKRHNYLRESDNAIPMIRLFNKDFFYIYIIQGKVGYGSHYIYNRNKKEGYLLKGRSPFLMHPCFNITDNVLMAMCQVSDLEHCIIPEFMSEIEKNKLKSIKMDDNPVIIKYYLNK